jgi:hypothetical protein
MKVNKKKCGYKIVRLENEIVIVELSFKWSRNDHTTRMVM